MAIDAKTVMALRKMTGAPMMDCKKALQETDGDMEKSKDILRKAGLQTGDGKAGREVEEGLIFSYVHHNGKLAVLCEIACETDFVARNEEFQQFGKDVCFHIAAMNPLYLNQDEVPAEDVAKERKILTEQAQEQMAGKPDEIVQKAVDGRMNKFYSEQCLMAQQFVKDDSHSVDEVRNLVIGKIGENIKITRFVRMELGA